MNMKMSYQVLAIVLGQAVILGQALVPRQVLSTEVTRPQALHQTTSPAPHHQTSSRPPALHQTTSPTPDHQPCTRPPD